MVRCVIIKVVFAAMRLSPLLALQGIFFANALSLALWLPRIPDVKDKLGLDIWTMALCLMAFPIGTMAGFLFAARLGQIIGLRRTCIIFNAVTALLLILPGFAPNIATLTAAFLITGLSIAQIEVAINNKANEVQRTLKRRIMSRCHGMWSFGAMAGGLIAGTYAQNGVSVAAQQITAEPLAALLAVLFGLALPPDAQRSPEHITKARLVMPSFPLAMLCLIPIGALLVEGSMFDWSVLFLRDEVGLDPFAASAVFSTFAMAMGIARLSGDWLAEKLGVARTMIISGLCMGLGMAAFALTPNLEIAALAALLTGFGAANVYPLAMSLAPDVPGQSSEQNVAFIALTAFTAFLIGPPLVGFLGDTYSLSIGLLALVPIGLVPAIMTWAGLMNSSSERTNP